MSNGIRRSNKRLPHKHGNIHGDGDGFQQQVRRCNYNNNNLLLRLPEELFADEILVRLPAKQLAQMRFPNHRHIADDICIANFFEIREQTFNLYMHSFIAGSKFDRSVFIIDGLSKTFL
uniref:uncharacterized protein LOC122607582 n=1 Tax=Erigeron canadensis TaxID=72917 RepID=UPI001CB899EB|nr:uncharacterized protein LOC122607582 [Erigeron canadensis]